MPRDIPGGHESSPPLEKGLHGILVNLAFVAALLACSVAQFAKVFTYFYAEKKWDWSRALSSGGMPSSHTAFVVGLTTAIGVQEGTSSNLFALAIVFTLVVAYDATGVRLHAGRQASVLNLIIAELPPEHPAQVTGVLRDSLGHTPLQVAVGAAVGLVVGYLLVILWGPRHAVTFG